jgi:hypothetical protein
MMDNNNLIERDALLQILWSAMELGLYRFAQQMAQTWLAAFPGDLQIQRFLAMAFSADGKQERAFELLDAVLRVDPLDITAWEAMAKLCNGWRPKEWLDAEASLYVLGGSVSLDEIGHLPEWSLTLHSLQNDKLDPVERVNRYRGLCLGKDAHVLAGVEFLRLRKGMNDDASLLKELSALQERWPDCVYFRFCLAEMKMQLGEDAQAVNLLHRCVVDDAAGQAAQRWWGNIHPYLSLWPVQMDVVSYLAIPAEIQRRLGGNLLPIRSALGNVSDRVAIGKSELSAENHQSVKKQGTDRLLTPVMQDRFVRDEEDGRYPVLVLITAIAGLDAKYGAAGRKMILQEMQRLSMVIRARPDWGACVICVDDAEHLKPFGLTPVSSKDAWKIKLLLADLDRSLAKKGERIGAVLIVGGDEVLPFHRLPNPADDMDDYVLSDNPYATSDENYFIPEWPVGRMVDGVDSNAGFLLRQLQDATHQHRWAIKRRVVHRRVPDWLLFSYWQQKLQLWLKRRNALRLGYTASAWRRSSIAVFRVIAPGNSLLVSPPEYAGNFENGSLKIPEFGYFNLHGMEDSADWYGQRDAHDPVGVDYPVALRPCDLEGSRRKNQAVIFSEACYGGNVNGKKESASIALRFLALGTRALVASTCTSYGSVQLPLIGADLLGQLFWQEVQAGCTAGQALTRAKVMLTQKLSKRQGYLDGEDQKTLLSFVLYGDPLAVIGQARGERMKVERSVRKVRFDTSPETIQYQPIEVAAMPGRVVQQVKSVVEPYLPGSGQADVQVCRRSGACGDDSVHAKSKMAMEQMVVTVTKQISIAQRTHRVYARVTLGENGEVTKLLVSRGGCLVEE